MSEIDVDSVMESEPVADSVLDGESDVDCVSEAVLLVVPETVSDADDDAVVEPVAR